MDKPVILFDADGFLLDFITPALVVADKVLARAREGWLHPIKCLLRFVSGQELPKLTVDDFPTWDIFDTIGKEHERACYVEYEKPGFCASFEPYPGAVEGVREAKKMADVVVVTSPLHSPTWCHERKQSLAEHFGIPSKDVIFASRKTLVMGRMLVDDRPSHSEEWAVRHTAGGVGVVWDQPYNRTHDTTNALAIGVNLVRCSSWDGRGGLLERIEHVARVHQLHREGNSNISFLET